MEETYYILATNCEDNDELRTWVLLSENLSYQDAQDRKQALLLEDNWERVISVTKPTFLSWAANDIIQALEEDRLCLCPASKIRQRKA